jgi:hypothetical protein
MATRLVALLTTVLLLAGCGGSTPDERLAANVRITVVAAPTCPVLQAGADPSLCAPRPVAGAPLEISGGEPENLTSNAEGLAALRLAPGDYTLTPGGVADYMGLPEPQAFRVEGDGVIELLVVYDTGIR